MALFFWLPTPWGLGLILLAAVLTLLVAYRLRDRATSQVYAIGIFGSLLVAPYVHVQDFALWIPASLLLMRSMTVPKGWTALGLFYSLLPMIGSAPISLIAGFLVLQRRRLSPVTSQLSIRLPVEPVSLTHQARP